MNIGTKALDVQKFKFYFYKKRPLKHVFLFHRFINLHYLYIYIIKYVVVCIV